MSAVQLRQGEVNWASLDPTVGRDNQHRPQITNHESLILALDQVRCLSVARLVSKITTVDPRPALHILQHMFAP